MQRAGLTQPHRHAHEEGLDRYADANDNFVLVPAGSGSDLEAHLVEELVEISGDTLVEPIQL
ncbi:MAG: hypothetical protein IT166_22170 [Bryobacterales bacterium]|nr:hypothetical protein [Bryobacterales bacterium]